MYLLNHYVSSRNKSHQGCTVFVPPWWRNSQKPKTWSDLCFIQLGEKDDQVIIPVECLLQLKIHRQMNSPFAKVTFILMQRKHIYVYINYIHNIQTQQNTCHWRDVCIKIWMCKWCIPSTSLTAVCLTISIEQLDKVLPQANFPQWFQNCLSILFAVLRLNRCGCNQFTSAISCHLVQ